MVMLYGKFFVVVIYFFFVIVFFLMWMSNIVIVVMMLLFVMGILSKFDLKCDYNIYVFVLFGIVYSVSIGGMGIFVGSFLNGIVVM